MIAKKNALKINIIVKSCLQSCLQTIQIRNLSDENMMNQKIKIIKIKNYAPQSSDQSIQIKILFKMSLFLRIITAGLFFLPGFISCAQGVVMTGAESTQEYIGMLRGKNVGIVANQTTVISGEHLVDSLLSLGVKVVRIYSPEHGFRGSADAGASVESGRDDRTGIQVISLYGRKQKPAPEDIAGIDVMVYDIQDLGVRFYTYISTMHYVMEACAENGIPLIILDRPNPNGHYTDGPIPEPEFKSFVGMHPIPVVYGMTAGELAQMINGEGWLANGVKCDLTVIKCKGYTHNTDYDIPVNPSPNITSMEAVYLYPTICFFEGTIMNVGRGTDFPFRVIGSPEYPDKSFSYTPAPNAGNANPMHNGRVCYGRDFSSMDKKRLEEFGNIKIEWIIDAYNKMGRRDDFFTAYFNTLAGTDKLKEQIVSGFSAEEIRAGWELGLAKFRYSREKYLIYE